MYDIHRKRDSQWCSYYMIVTDRTCELLVIGECVVDCLNLLRDRVGGI